MKWNTCTLHGATYPTQVVGQRRHWLTRIALCGVKAPHGLLLVLFRKVGAVALALAAFALVFVNGGFGYGGLLPEAPSVLPGTSPLTAEGDLASQMIDGIHRFLDKYAAVVKERRLDRWNALIPPGESPAEPQRAAVLNNLTELRSRLRHICGVRDNLAPSPILRVRAAVSEDPRVAFSPSVDIYEVSWSAFDDVTGEGLLLVPRQRPPLAHVVAVPDADQSPEEISGLNPETQPERAWAMRLAQAGCQVLVPTLVGRQIRPLYRVKLTQREYLYRPAYELGRHIVGFEVEKVLAGLEALRRSASEGAITGSDNQEEIPLAIAGWGEGGLVALLAAALCGGDGLVWPQRRPNPGLPSTMWMPEKETGSEPARGPLQVVAVMVSGFFGPRELMWQEPIDRNIFGFVKDFGAAELVALAAPAQVIVDKTTGPEVVVPAGLGGSPGKLGRVIGPEVEAEFRRAHDLVARLKRVLPAAELPISVDEAVEMAGVSEKAIAALLRKISGAETVTVPEIPTVSRVRETDPVAREARQIRELERHVMWLLEESRFVRRERFPYTDTSVDRRVPLEEYEKIIARERESFYGEVIGKIDWPVAPLVASSRLWRTTEAWVGYEVVIDVFPPDVFAYGILLVPRDLKPGERRPVVVCQHGLEGRPQETIEGNHRAYHDFAARLAERGFVVFAPQNPYIFQDRFRLLQRKLNPLGCTLFSVIIPQHAQIIEFLKAQPFVDPGRIAFYGLSYGGKTAMRVPAVLTDYCLSICSADFNEWVWKNAAINTRGQYSYVFTIEYEIFEFDLGSTFNYAEMAALIAPRPFMVERGHLDGVAPDETVAYEFAKVRYLYAVVLGVPERCEIEWFVGPHTIHGVRTFAFLHRFLRWPPQSP